LIDRVDGLMVPAGALGAQCPPGELAICVETHPRWLGGQLVPGNRVVTCVCVAEAKRSGPLSTCGCRESSSVGSINLSIYRFIESSIDGVRLLPIDEWIMEGWID
jgi:hypothetical protein